ncbi:hypothetical protein BZG36_03217 [Bifiguratus adelaidae]|uniref:Protein kinase domain-containing protein n=1 Tax=Bifiguratus adelaidae TaxID=1938954 RepID=A0A261XWV9_9FUNG|nr:hypothetical protein BZG36_03217 [Bifiguratus adelaidae]
MAFLSGIVKSSLSLLGKDGSAFPYSIGDKAEWYSGQSIWTLYQGTKKEDGSPVSVFRYERQTGQADKFLLAKNAFRRFRTIRHPDLLKYLDGLEASGNDQNIYIVTERVEPLENQLKQDANKDLTIWGLYKVANAIKFLNDDCGAVHGNVKMSSIFTDQAGEWKLGGLELLSIMKEDSPIVLTSSSESVPESHRYTSPEARKSGWEIIKDIPINATDSWLFGLLIYEVFNGIFSTQEQLNARKEIPSNLFQSYKSLINQNPKLRANMKKILDVGLRPNGAFDTQFVKVNLFLENIAIKEQSEKDAFFKDLGVNIDNYPPDFCKYKILPTLVHAFEFGAGGSSALNAILKIGNHLSDEEYNDIIIACLVRMYGSQDRAIRYSLLENLPNYIEHLSDKTVSDKLFPNVATGFNDGAPIIREQTVKAILLLMPKLNDRIRNYDLLRYLAKMQTDDEPGIRTNTTICLGKMAKYLNDGTRKKVLVPAFTRALRDPFVHARVASLMALNATSEYFDAPDCATKIIPCVSMNLIDKEKVVRTQAFKSLEVFVKRLQMLADKMPDTELKEAPMPSQANSNSTPLQSQYSAAAISMAGSVGKEAAGWAGWAVTSLATRVMNSSVEGTMDQEAAAKPPVKPENGNGPDDAAASTHDVRLKKVDSSKFSVSDDGVDIQETNGWGDANLITFETEDDWAPLDASAEVGSSTSLEDDVQAIVAARPSVTASFAPATPNPTSHSGKPAKQSMKLAGMKPKADPLSGWGLDEDDSWAGVTIPKTATSPKATAASNVSPVSSFHPPVQNQVKSNSPRLTKEERQAELERKKEERRQRLAELRQQKQASGVRKL